MDRVPLGARTEPPRRRLRQLLACFRSGWLRALVVPRSRATVVITARGRDRRATRPGSARLGATCRAGGAGCARLVSPLAADASRSRTEEAVLDKPCHPFRGGPRNTQG